jgi:hypothetical protein
MGSYPRREKAEQKARERADTVPALDCQSWPLTPGERFRYYADQIVCEACDERNPQSRLALGAASWLSMQNQRPESFLAARRVEKILQHAQWSRTSTRTRNSI